MQKLVQAVQVQASSRRRSGAASSHCGSHLSTSSLAMYLLSVYFWIGWTFMHSVPTLSSGSYSPRFELTRRSRVTHVSNLRDEGHTYGFLKIQKKSPPLEKVWKTKKQNKNVFCLVFTEIEFQIFIYSLLVPTPSLPPSLLPLHLLV